MPQWVSCGLWGQQQGGGGAPRAQLSKHGPCSAPHCHLGVHSLSLSRSFRCIGSTVGLVEASRRHRQSGPLVPGGIPHPGRPSSTTSLEAACPNTPLFPATQPVASGLRQLALHCSSVSCRHLGPQGFQEVLGLCSSLVQVLSKRCPAATVDCHPIEAWLCLPAPT